MQCMRDWQFVWWEAHCPGKVGLTTQWRRIQKNRVVIGTLWPANASSDKRCQWMSVGLLLMLNAHTCTGKPCPRKSIWSAFWKYTLKEALFHLSSVTRLHPRINQEKTEKEQHVDRVLTFIISSIEFVYIDNTERTFWQSYIYASS